MARDIKVNAKMTKDIKVNAEAVKDIKVKAILGQTVVKITQGGLPYTDRYIIDPDFNGTTLETKDKYLVQDIKINPIKVESVSNLSGGRTVYIGGNINYG